MRGAMLVDAGSGERLENDPARGIRATRMDLSPVAEADLHRELLRRGIDNPHVREALVLAAKVVCAPGIVAELCWSDDPDYTAGYVCTPVHGYFRFPHLKPAGDERGGRAFFLRPGIDPAPTVHFLEKAVILFTEIGTFHPDRTPE
jgi:6-carboxyhexanoate--CoA ligase